MSATRCGHERLMDKRPVSPGSSELSPTARRPSFSPLSFAGPGDPRATPWPPRAEPRRAPSPPPPPRSLRARRDTAGLSPPSGVLAPATKAARKARGDRPVASGRAQHEPGPFSGMTPGGREANALGSGAGSYAEPGRPNPAHSHPAPPFSPFRKSPPRRCPTHTPPTGRCGGQGRALAPGARPPPRVPAAAHLARMRHEGRGLGAALASAGMPCPLTVSRLGAIAFSAPRTAPRVGGASSAWAVVGPKPLAFRTEASRADITKLRTKQTFASPGRELAQGADPGFALRPAAPGRCPRTPVRPASLPAPTGKLRPRCSPGRGPKRSYRGRTATAI
ncbi:translation initiation factor IF-2 [Echinops telfairi]|uniref:Translation initiation factor IF-2 n=1 Tax=Echinops telfairi TaxID=9371 RepID=A0ABM0ZQG2_ECHTE|nr:translation initiation factor IF-2 [Echinops telfairi]